MIKILLLALSVWLILRILKSYRTNLDKQNQKNTSLEDMVRCAECGVHHPISDSFLVKGKHYCCVAHSKISKP
jgi:uncharacterized protein